MKGCLAIALLATALPCFSVSAFNATTSAKRSDLAVTFDRSGSIRVITKAQKIASGVLAKMFPGALRTKPKKQPRVSSLAKPGMTLLSFLAASCMTLPHFEPKVVPIDGEVTFTIEEINAMGGPEHTRFFLQVEGGNCKVTLAPKDNLNDIETTYGGWGISHPNWVPVSLYVKGATGANDMRWAPFKASTCAKVIITGPGQQSQRSNSRLAPPTKEPLPSHLGTVGGLARIDDQVIPGLRCGGVR